MEETYIINPVVAKLYVQKYVDKLCGFYRPQLHPTPLGWSIIMFICPHTFGHKVYLTALLDFSRLLWASKKDICDS